MHGNSRQKGCLSQQGSFWWSMMGEFGFKLILAGIWL